MVWQVTDYAYPAAITRSSNFLGKSAWFDPYFNGNIDEIRMYNRVLTSEDAWLLYDDDLEFSTPYGAASCVACPAGTYSSRGSSCIACSPGSYQSSTGLDSCVACPKGKKKTRVFVSLIGRKCHLEWLFMCVKGVMHQLELWRTLRVQQAHTLHLY